MDKQQAEREAAAHELAAERNPRKRVGHLLAARLLRQANGIPEPAADPFGRDHDAINRRRAVEADWQSKVEEFKRK